MNIWVGVDPTGLRGVGELSWPNPTWIFRSFPVEIEKRLYKMALLIPNTRHQYSNNIDLIFCMPVKYEKWNKWQALSIAHNKCIQSINYMDRVEDGKAKTIIMLPGVDQSDEDVLTAVAYMRMVEGITCRVYVVRATFTIPSQAAIMNAVLGAHPETIINVPEGFGSNEQEATDN